MSHTALPAAPPVPLPPGRVEVTYCGHQAFSVTMRGHTVVTDQPRDAGGDDIGPTPVELFVVSLASCVAHYARGFLERHHLDVERLAVTAESTMADDRPARVASVRLYVTTPPGLSHRTPRGTACGGRPPHGPRHAPPPAADHRRVRMSTPPRRP